MKRAGIKMNEEPAPAMAGEDNLGADIDPMATSVETPDDGVSVPSC